MSCQSADLSSSQRRTNIPTPLTTDAIASASDVPQMPALSHSSPSAPCERSSTDRMRASSDASSHSWPTSSHLPLSITHPHHSHHRSNGSASVSSTSLSITAPSPTMANTNSHSSSSNSNTATVSTRRRCQSEVTLRQSSGSGSRHPSEGTPTRQLLPIVGQPGKSGAVSSSTSSAPLRQLSMAQSVPPSPARLASENPSLTVTSPARRCYLGADHQTTRQPAIPLTPEENATSTTTSNNPGSSTTGAPDSLQHSAEVDRGQSTTTASSLSYLQEHPSVALLVNNLYQSVLASQPEEPIRYMARQLQPPPAIGDGASAGADVLAGQREGAPHAVVDAPVPAVEGATTEEAQQNPVSPVAQSTEEDSSDDAHRGEGPSGRLPQRPPSPPSSGRPNGRPPRAKQIRTADSGVASLPREHSPVEEAEPHDHLQVPPTRRPPPAPCNALSPPQDALHQQSHSTRSTGGSLDSGVLADLMSPRPTHGPHAHGGSGSSNGNGGSANGAGRLPPSAPPNFNTRGHSGPARGMPEALSRFGSGSSTHQAWKPTTSTAAAAAATAAAAASAVPPHHSSSGCAVGVTFTGNNYGSLVGAAVSLGGSLSGVERGDVSPSDMSSFLSNASVDVQEFIHEFRTAKEEQIGGLEKPHITFDDLACIVETIPFSVPDAALLSELFDDLITTPSAPVVSPVWPSRQVSTGSGRAAADAPPPSEGKSLLSSSGRSNAYNGAGYITAAQPSAAFPSLSPPQLGNISGGLPNMNGNAVYAGTSGSAAATPAEERTVLFEALLARMAYKIQGRYPAEAVRIAFFAMVVDDDPTSETHKADEVESSLTNIGSGADRPTRGLTTTTTTTATGYSAESVTPSETPVLLNPHLLSTQSAAPLTPFNSTCTVPLARCIAEGLHHRLGMVDVTAADVQRALRIAGLPQDGDEYRGFECHLQDFGRLVHAVATTAAAGDRGMTCSPGNPYLSSLRESYLQRAGTSSASWREDSGAPTAGTFSLNR